MLVGMIGEDEFDEDARRVRGGVAVVSVWFERDDPAAIPRARITTAIGTRGGRVSRTAAGDEEILRVVRVWLAQLRGRSNDAATLAGRIGDAGATGDADRQ